MAKKPKPWERQPEESTKAFEAFQCYRDMGMERNIMAVTRELNKSRTIIGRWSSAHNWVERCAAWDSEQDRILREQQQNEIKKMRRKHASLADRTLKKLAESLEYIDPEEIKPSDFARLLDVATKLERISLGDTTDVVENREAEEKQPPAVLFYMPDNGRKIPGKQTSEEEELED